MTWFNSREPRERVLLMILAGLIFVFAAWFALSRESGPNGTATLEAAQADRELWLRAAPRLGSTAISGERSEFTRGALVDAARKRGVSLSRVQRREWQPVFQSSPPARHKSAYRREECSAEPPRFAAENLCRMSRGVL